MLRLYRTAGRRMAALLGPGKRNWRLVLLLGALLVVVAVLQAERRGDKVRHLLEKQAERSEQQPVQ